jgi:hypothetical protein
MANHPQWMTETTILCTKCGQTKDQSEFWSAYHSKTVGWCTKCREYGRQAMKRYHSRRQLGIAVAQGRPRTNHIIDALNIGFIIDRSQLPEYEAFHAGKQKELLEKFPDHITAGDFPLGYEIGRDTGTATATTPQMRKAKGNKSSTVRPRNADEQAFVDACEKEYRQAMLKAGSSGSGGVHLFDMAFNRWQVAGKPENWNPRAKPKPQSKPQQDEDDASELAPQG